MYEYKSMTLIEFVMTFIDLSKTQIYGGWIILTYYKTISTIFLIVLQPYLMVFN